MADSRQSIFTAAKSAGYVNSNAENFYKPGSWQHKAWADGVQAGIDAALALGPVAKTIDEIKRFDAAYFERMAVGDKINDTIERNEVLPLIQTRTTAYTGKITSEEMHAMLERFSAPPPPVIEHIRCLIVDADNCDLCGNVQRAERLRNKAVKLAQRYSAY